MVSDRCQVSALVSLSGLKTSDQCVCTTRGTTLSVTLQLCSTFAASESRMCSVKQINPCYQNMPEQRSSIFISPLLLVFSYIIRSGVCWCLLGLQQLTGCCLQKEDAALNNEARSVESYLNILTVLMMHVFFFSLSLCHISSSQNISTLREMSGCFEVSNISLILRACSSLTLSLWCFIRLYSLVNLVNLCCVVLCLWFIVLNMHT